MMYVTYVYVRSSNSYTEAGDWFVIFAADNSRMSAACRYLISAVSNTDCDFVFLYAYVV